MNRELCCFVNMEMSVKQCYEFLEKFIIFAPDFKSARTNAMKGYIEFNNYKKLPDDKDSEELYKWLMKNWGCTYIPDIERIEILIVKNEYERDYCDEEYNPVFDVNIYNKHTFDRRNLDGSEFVLEKNWYKSEKIERILVPHNKMYYNVKDIINTHSDIIEWCKNELKERGTDINEFLDYDEYDIHINLKICTDQFPIEIFKYWASEFCFEMFVTTISLSGGEFIDKYKFTTDGYEYNELTYEKDPEEYYLELLNNHCLNTDWVYDKVAEVLEEMYAYEKNDKITNFANAVKKSLYKLKDNYSTIAKIIATSRQMYESYLDKINKEEK